MLYFINDYYNDNSHTIYFFKLRMNLLRLTYSKLLFITLDFKKVLYEFSKHCITVFFYIFFNFFILLTNFKIVKKIVQITNRDICFLFENVAFVCIDPLSAGFFTFLKLGLIEGVLQCYTREHGSQSF